MRVYLAMMYYGIHHSSIPYITMVMLQFKSKLPGSSTEINDAGELPLQ